ncbi:MAG: LytTR family DNA-binding domain-containing protein [Bacteroidota bacterium]
MRYKTIIIDDERDAREGISLLLQQDETIDMVALCSNGLSAIEEIKYHKPDIIFLDVQMPQISGFDVLRSVDYMPKAVIFVTAYDNFALKAFEVRAIDYLLKPFSDRRFYQALEHAKERLVSDNQANSAELLNDLASNSTTQAEWVEKSAANRLVVKDKGKVHILNHDDIRWLEAYDYYVKIHLQGHFLLLRESLKKLEVRLQPFGFLRVHKSAIVNSKYISSVEPVTSKEFMLDMKEGQRVKVSRNYKNSLFEYLNANR